jgi:hypothetical protein
MSIFRNLCVDFLRGLQTYLWKRRAAKCSVTVSDLLGTMPELPPFSWEREYARHWEGRFDDSLNAFFFAPGPDDLFTVKYAHGTVTAPLRDHQSGKAERDAEMAKLTAHQAYGHLYGMSQYQGQYAQQSLYGNILGRGLQ